ncbi:hypothetical protein IW261DRAFT_382692 [Armillaria novae-zelandiae]|uniref:Uncharacterized protein n=1 Tax=Armillaria novae-zelandiae TaxID=153914 RepID=A0AA39THF7_9AGAR|nr:hypothetical protein IW261DRAFT_382692 [Armillaria novae-zelandiae]
MAIFQPTPGVVYLFRTVTTILILPCSALWALQAGLRQFEVILPPWLYLVAPFLSQLIGAIMMPSVQETSISIVRSMLHSFKNGYPAERFQKWSEEYGNTFSLSLFGETRVVTLEPSHVKAILATQFQDFQKGLHQNYSYRVVL